MDDVIVVIPAYESESTVGDVVARVKDALPSLRVLVVDDGSTDNTATAAERAGACVIRHNSNRGKGGALLTGFGWVTKEDAAAAAITLDSDGQHDPVHLQAFIDCWSQHRPDIIVGARDRSGSAMPFARRCSNWLSSKMVSRLAGTHVADSQSGYRLYHRRVWETLDISATGYELESEILVAAGRKQMSIVELPISTIYGDEESRFDGWKDTSRISSLFWRQFRHWI